MHAPQQHVALAHAQGGLDGRVLLQEVAKEARIEELGRGRHPQPQPAPLQTFERL